MRKKEHKPSGNAVLRILFVGVSLLFQIGWLLLLILELNEYSARISLITSILSVVVVLKLYSKHVNSAMKMPWIMRILAFPVMGLCLYLLFELLGDPGVGKLLRTVRGQMQGALTQDEAVMERLKEKSVPAANQFRYLWKTAGCPV